MKELNLSVSAGGDKDNTVVLTAKCDNYEEAVAFHDGLARLCREASKPASKLSRPFTGLLSYKGRDP
jgi:hypothetical protein